MLGQFVSNPCFYCGYGLKVGFSHMLSTDICGKRRRYIFILNQPPKFTLHIPDTGTNEPPNSLMGARGLVESHYHPARVARL